MSAPLCVIKDKNLKMQSALPATSRKRKSPDADAAGVGPDDENKTFEQWVSQHYQKQIDALKKRSANNVKRLRSEFDEVSVMMRQGSLRFDYPATGMQCPDCPFHVLHTMIGFHALPRAPLVLPISRVTTSPPLQPFFSPEWWGGEGGVVSSLSVSALLKHAI